MPRVLIYRRNDGISWESPWCGTEGQKKNVSPALCTALIWLVPQQLGIPASSAICTVGSIRVVHNQPRWYLRSQYVYLRSPDRQLSWPSASGYCWRRGALFFYHLLSSSSWTRPVLQISCFYVHSHPIRGDLGLAFEFALALASYAYHRSAFGSSMGIALPFAFSVVAYHCLSLVAATIAWRISPFHPLARFPGWVLHLADVL